MRKLRVHHLPAEAPQLLLMEFLRKIWFRIEQVPLMYFKLFEKLSMLKHCYNKFAGIPRRAFVRTIGGVINIITGSKDHLRLYHLRLYHLRLYRLRLLYHLRLYHLRLSRLRLYQKEY
jgi:hypothetical protein